MFFGTVVGWLTCWIVPYASYDMEHATPGSMLRASRSSNASSGLPGPQEHRFQQQTTSNKQQETRGHEEGERTGTPPREAHFKPTVDGSPPCCFDYFDYFDLEN